MKRVRANLTFLDVQETERQKKDTYRKKGEEFIVSDERAWELTQTMYNNRTYYCDYVEIPWRNSTEPKILIYNHDLYKIGGTETFLYNLCKYYKTKNIVVMYRSGKSEFINLLHKYTPMCRDDGISNYDCDVLIMGNFFAGDIYPRVKAKQKYQMIHADYRGIRAAGFNIQLDKPSDVKLITVSNIASDGVKEVFGYNSIIQYNILDKEMAKEKPLILLSLTRATREKGIHRVVALAKALKAAKKDFMWILAGTIYEQAPESIKKELQAIPEIIPIPANINNRVLIKAADYLVQLSDTESFCYAAYEALIMKKPVILTDFPAARECVVDGENGYIISLDETTYDKDLVNKICNKIPKNITYEDRCDYDLWEKIFAGEKVEVK